MAWLQEFFGQMLTAANGGKTPDMEDLFLPLVVMMVMGFVLTAITYRMRSHKHQNQFNTHHPLVTLGSLSLLGFVVLFSMKSLGIFEMAPFTLINSGLRNSMIVGGILFSVALVPLIDDLRHQYQHHS